MAVERDPFLQDLAMALVVYPRANLHELAQAVGVSKATLHRLAGTRDNLIQEVQNYSVNLINELLNDSKLDEGPPEEALKRMIDGHLAHKEVMLFAFHYCKEDQTDTEYTWQKHQDLLDRFFLRGQQQGVFRMDIPASYLCEYFCWALVGFIEAERVGRVARVGLSDIIETLVLSGMTAPK